jgi:4-hydroxysphinganine ceramide fatty acyl 2-hydroxylase
MKDFKIDNKGSGQLFQNKFLEKLTRTHFLVPVILYFVVSALCIFHGYQVLAAGFWKIIYMFPLGWLTFTLVEYLIHRYIFHFNATTEKELNIQYSIHGVHHEFPRDKDRLVMPPVMSIVVAIIFFSIFSLVTGIYVWLFFPGFASGYSVYLLIHYSVHRFRPPANFLKYLWKHHSLHHYHSIEVAFGVSFPLWDHLFGTMPKSRKSTSHIETDRLPDTIS